MALSIWRHLVFLLALCGCAALADAQQKSKPLTNSELLALLAGNALSENIVREIQSRGMVFPPSDGFRPQLKDAGADARVLAALGKATISSATGAADHKESSELLQHLSAAGKLMRAKQYQGAAEELDAALQANGGADRCRGPLDVQH
jgi:hypothetical protein